MRVLYLGLRLRAHFLNLFFLIFRVFNRFASLQVIHCHYQSQASSMPSEEEWFTYDTTILLHLNNHIQNQRNARRKQENDGHLQHIMASLDIIYNLWFLFCGVTLICLYSHRWDVLWKLRVKRQHRSAFSNSHYKITMSKRQVLPSYLLQTL